MTHATRRPEVPTGGMVRATGALACAAVLGVLAGCSDMPSGAEAVTAELVARDGAVRPVTGRGVPGVVQVTSSGMSFDAPESISAGWTTFRYQNRTPVTHFFVLERMPEGKTVADSEAEVVPVFQDAMDLIVAGDPEAGFAEFGRLPAWFFDVAFMGGPGLVAPGGTAQTTVYLEPGTYVIECYVKTPGGIFHSALGMLRGLTVTEEWSDATEPEASVMVSIGDAGITLDGEPRPGMRTFGVRFDQQQPHEHFIGHDVHLARLEDDTDLDALAAWMDWSAVEGLTTPAPATFLGGTQELPAGATSYFTARLEPGRYALVAEVPDPASKGMLVTFDVPSARAD